MVDAEGVGRGDCSVWYRGVEHGPFILQGVTVSGALCEEGGDFIGAAANAEGADASLFNLRLEEPEEAVVSKIAGRCFVEEPQVNLAGAEGGEAAVE